MKKSLKVITFQVMCPFSSYQKETIYYITLPKVYITQQLFIYLFFKEELLSLLLMVEVDVNITSNSQLNICL